MVVDPPTRRPVPTFTYTRIYIYMVVYIHIIHILYIIYVYI